MSLFKHNSQQLLTKNANLTTVQVEMNETSTKAEAKQNNDNSIYVFEKQNGDYFEHSTIADNQFKMISQLHFANPVRKQKKIL